MHSCMLPALECCGEQGLLLHGPGQWEFLSCRVPAVRCELYAREVQIDSGIKLVHSCMLPALECCGEQGLLLHEPGHFVEMGSMCPAVTLHCRQTWAADLFKPLHCIMMADQHAVVWRGCCSMEQGTLGRWAACVLL